MKSIMISIHRKDESVNLSALSPPMCRALIICADVYTQNGIALVVTSGNDGKHKTGSKHYGDDAIDARTKTIEPSAKKHSMVNEIKKRLGIGYDVILEHEGKPNEHLHIEWDPK